METRTATTKYRCHSCKELFEGRTGPHGIHVQCPHCNRVSYAASAEVSIIDRAKSATLRQELNDLKRDAMILAESVKLPWNSPAYTAFRNEIECHARFPHSESNEPLAPLAQAFLAEVGR